MHHADAGPKRVPRRVEVDARAVTRISPASARDAGEILPSVLLPAPFSPHSAWQDPFAIAKLTSSSARTPGKRLLTPRNSTATTVLLQLQVLLGTSVNPQA